MTPEPTTGPGYQHSLQHRNHAAASAGNREFSRGALANSTAVCLGSATGSCDVLAMHTKSSPRANVTTPGADGSHDNGPGPSEGVARRMCNAARYSSSIDSGSPVSAATVRVFHPAGCGSHGSLPGAPNPNGELSPSHGIGTRQPSRPRSV